MRDAARFFAYVAPFLGLIAALAIRALRLNHGGRQEGVSDGLRLSYVLALVLAVIYVNEETKRRARAQAFGDDRASLILRMDGSKRSAHGTLAPLESAVYWMSFLATSEAEVVILEERYTKLVQRFGKKRADRWARFQLVAALWRAIPKWVGGVIKLALGTSVAHSILGKAADLFKDLKISK